MKPTEPAKRRRKKADEPPEDASSPKTPRPEASERREPEPAKTTAEKIHRKLDAFPDRIDLRDWLYQPRLAPLPDLLINCDSVPRILDQGTEGACTGFALAAVVNFQLQRRNLERRVSPRMLYEMARRYDEWPGEEYEGSSARGAMKGWVAHGVCTEVSWPIGLHGAGHLTPAVAVESRGTPGGAYFRVTHRNIRDMHAALAEAGILFASLMVHDGWQEPGPATRKITYIESGNLRERTFPIVRRTGRATSGHAVAIVGYTEEGFIIQNSWGDAWGVDGFALLPYEDYLLHATDVWVAQLGVPVKLDLWATDPDTRDNTAGMHRAAVAVPLADIRPYVIDVANNGELSDSGEYWTTDQDIERLFGEEIPRTTAAWPKKRLLFYLHGGLNDEAGTARRIVAYRDVLLENHIYPIHIMWESGVMESLTGIIQDLFTDVDERAGSVADWLRKFREGLIEAKDRTLELTAAVPGTLLWNEMKENASLASNHPDDKGAMQRVAHYAHAAHKALSADDRKAWELHVVGHSAGSIFVAAALPHFLELGFPFRTLQLFAPAITVRDFKKLMVPRIDSGKCPQPTMYVLSDVGERDDHVGPYGKSLLYLVSNAFQGRRGTPILGMQRFISDDDLQPGEANDVDPVMNALFKKKVDGLPSLLIAGKDYGNPASVSRSETHGGFDNDPDTLNSMLRRILDGEPKRLFGVRDLQF